MGYPGNTIELPRWDPALAHEIASVVIDPDGDLEQLLALSTTAVTEANKLGGRGLHGHLCSTAWVIDNTASYVLLVRHRRLGWVVPGGHSEIGESLRDGAIRELAEETGLVIEPLVEHPVLLHPARFPAGQSPEHDHWNLGFVFVADTTTPLVEEDGVAVAWWPIDTLPTPRVDDLDSNLTRIVAWGSALTDR